MTTAHAASTLDPATMSVEDLLALIAGRYQRSCRDAFPELVALARKVERVHHDMAEAPLGLADALDRMALDLDMHMEEEDRVLFPAMRASLDSAIAHPLAVMRREHDSYAADIDTVEQMTQGFTAPNGACGSWRRLYEGVAQLCSDLREQIRIENDVLFPGRPFSPPSP